MATSYLICFFARFAKAQHQILGLLSHYGGAREFVSHRLFFQRRKILLTLSHSFMLKFVTLKITALLLPNKLQSQRVNYLGFQVCPQAAQCLSPRRQVEEKSPLKLALESYQPGGYGCGSADDDEDQQCYNLTTLSPPPRPTLVTAAAAQKEEANTQVFRPENNFFPLLLLLPSFSARSAFHLACFTAALGPPQSSRFILLWTAQKLRDLLSIAKTNLADLRLV